MSIMNLSVQQSPDLTSQQPLLARAQLQLVLVKYPLVLQRCLVGARILIFFGFNPKPIPELGKL
jgi:hypothetical protein